MKTFATILLAGFITLAPFQAIHAAPPADFEKGVAPIKTQTQLLEMRIAKIEAGKLKTKTQKRMNTTTTITSTDLPKGVIELDVEWAKREAELNAKYKIPGKWKLLDERGIKEYKKYQEEREALLSK